MAVAEACLTVFVALVVLSAALDQMIDLIFRR